MKRVEAVIFDWAGTTIDHGSLAPVRAVSELLHGRGIDVTDAEVRVDMGIYKKDHIRNVLRNPRVELQWRNRFGASPQEEDIEQLFQEFIPVQTNVLEARALVLPGVVELSKRLYSQGLKIGSTTGYTRPMLELVEKAANQQGYFPQRSYCPDEVRAGRPFPYMCLRLALDFELSSVAAAVKVGDTPSDIAEARNAGMWAVGVTSTGNEVGLDERDWAALRAAERAELLFSARKRLHAAGAHFIIDAARDLEPVIEQINGSLADGRTP